MHLRLCRLMPALLTLCAAALAWWILSVYEPVVPVRNSPGVTLQFDGKQAMRHLDALTHKYKGRVVGSAQGFAAADYVAQEFRSYGEKVITQDFREIGATRNGSSFGWHKGRNVIGVLPGKTQGTIVFTAHRDCVPDAPEGAYDNASGAAVVLELARVLASRKPLRYTCAFAALDGEEIGMAGARVLLNNIPGELEDLRLMVNLDMVGFKNKPNLGIAHTQYLSPDARALVAGRFPIPAYSLLQLPLGRGTDAQLYVLRGLATLDIREVMPMFTKMEYHSPGDTFDQVSAESMQQAGRAVEQLILQGDAMGAFTPTVGVMASNGKSVLPVWRYLLGGACIFFALAVPFLFRLHPIPFGGPVKAIAVLILLTGIPTALSTLWAGGVAFIVLPVFGSIAILAAQAIALRRTKIPDPGLGLLFLAAAPPLVFAGTWFLSGLWPLGLQTAVLAYVPAVLVTWKTGWRWRLLDIALLLPGFLISLLIALVAWITSPAHLFPSVKLGFFTALYMAAALVGIWGMFGRRPARHRILNDGLPKQESPTTIAGIVD